MAVDRVLEPGEILLDGKYYRLREGTKVQRSRTQYAQKLVIGDYTLESRPNVSAKTWRDWRGGIGLFRDRGVAHSRSWASQLSDRFLGHLTLPPLDTFSSASGETVSAGWDGAIGELANVVYVAFGTKVRSYTSASDTWSALLDTLPGNALSAITVVLAGTRYLIFGQAAGFTYTSDGAAFTDVVKDSDYLAFWDDKLWGIDDTGQLWYTAAIATAPTNDAKVPLGIGSVGSLFVGPDATGEPILYAGTTEGLFAHDFANQRFIATGLTWPHAANCGGACTWRNNIYIIYGSFGVFEYNPIAGTVRTMGPDQDDGLQSTYIVAGVYLKQLLPSFRELIALPNASSSLPMLALSWDGLGWHQPLNTSGYGWPGLVSNAYSTYRLYLAARSANAIIRYVALPTDASDNPEQKANLTYATSGTLETPVFAPEDPDVTLTALDVTVVTRGVGSTTPTTSETVTVSYSLNYATGTFTAFSAITCEATKTTTFQFPNASTPTGTDFKAIQFRIRLDRGVTGSNPERKSPDVLQMILAYRRKLSTKRRFTVMVDCTQIKKGRMMDDQLADLDTAVNSSAKVAFIYRDSAKGGTTYYVDARYLELQEETGRKEEGVVALELVEL